MKIDFDSIDMSNPASPQAYLFIRFQQNPRPHSERF